MCIRRRDLSPPPKARARVCVELNLEPSAGSDYFDESILGPATRVAPDFFTRLPLSD